MRRAPLRAPHPSLREVQAIDAPPTAVIVMAKYPIAGRVKTRLTPPLTPDQAAQLSRGFLLDKLEQVRRVRAATRYLAFAPPEAEAAFAQWTQPDFALVAQVGSDLGERLAGLVTRVWAQRVSPVVIVGTDSPTLPDEYLAEAIGVLNQGGRRRHRSCGGWELLPHRPAAARAVRLPWHPVEHIGRCPRNRGPGADRRAPITPSPGVVRRGYRARPAAPGARRGARRRPGAQHARVRSGPPLVVTAHSEAAPAPSRLAVSGLLW